MAIPAPVRLSERAYLLPGGVNIVLVVDGRGAVAIDSGQGSGGAKRVRRALEALGVELRALLTTHAHADHFGGHATLLRQRRVPVYAPALEAELMRAPRLEPIYLAHGADPPPELLVPWLMAEASPVDHLLLPGPLTVGGVDVVVHDVSGHAHGQVAIEVDDVLVAADAVFGPEVLARHPIPFGQDVARQVEAAAWVGAHGARLAVPGHGAPAPPAALADATTAALERVRRAVLAAVTAAAPVPIDALEVLARAATTLGVADPDLARWHLQHTTVQAHLGALRAAGRLTPLLRGHRLLWQAS
jgi:glyoxylase-like metal-dependent hydrolase (beta-lactamase superfamily II)